MDLENKDEIISRYTTLSYQDATSKAQAIEKIYTMGNQFGVPGELILQAMSEIINTQKETPATDQVMQMLEQAFQKEMQMQEAQQQQALDNATNMLMATPQAQQQIQQEAAALESGNMGQMPIA